MVLRDKKKRKVIIMDVAVPNSNNMMETIAEKQRKYRELQQEIKRMWQVEDVNVVPLVITTTKVLPKCINGSITQLELSSA